MIDLFSHSLTGILGVVAGIVGCWLTYRVNLRNTKLQERRQESDERRQETEQLKAMFEATNRDRQVQGLRITELEKRQEEANKEHIKCIEAQANLRAKVEYLEKSLVAAEAIGQREAQSKHGEILVQVLSKLDDLKACVTHEGKPSS